MARPAAAGAPRRPWRSAALALLLALAAGAALRQPARDEAADFDWGALPPWPAFRALDAAFAALPRLLARVLPPPLLLLDLAAGAIHQQALYALAELGVADALKAGPRGVEALAAGAGVEPDALQRLLKAASSKGVFREAAPRVWANNRVSALLRADHPSSMRPMVRHWGGESYAPHHHVLEAIKMGSPHANAFEAWSGGEPLWKWYDRPENAAVNSNFNAAMAGFSKIVDAAIVADLDWPARFGASATVADVGGGVGAALAALLRAHPGFRGALLDRPSAVAEARRVWAAPSHAALAPRAELRAGDFFKAADVPAADVFFLRFIIHDHADADALIILRALRETAAARMKETGQAAVHLVVCDMVLPDAGPPAPFQAAVDLQMLAMLSARERTAAEFKELLAAGGWAVEDVVRIRAPVGLVVARAA